MTRFQNWCRLMGNHSLPAAPVVVAAFIGDNGGLKPDELLAEVAAIDEQHQALGYAPPGRSDVALKAFDAVHPVEPPRSWPKEEKRRFLELPHDLQVYFAEHEDRREKEIKRAFSEAAAARQKLEEMEANGARQDNAA
ncbi:hypothetical protein M2222_001644 [Bradyrhizobium elkanii]|uniref:hypothetical protein n=1 Tax=Bradyrhizobium elkanii TaxID=29448 RepID=UPI00216AA923|nr:hypothetical protein [Bradyrhizobium elkanii]MCS3449535.1 hypothetical protein [Bradyrhizobium elkanii]MCS3559322.1 hypothetical protein [Bradyrhizobium elkanii]MCW2150832.1 hypothetical protein [Bradyrhizobium elkanii]MCW2374563.1 hypothetical protein [Bradyrhizobium elkanii]